MQASAQEYEAIQSEPASTVSWREAQREDAYWQCVFSQERYYRPPLGYEDYAPAYCVGYAGWSQYGGDFADAAASLRANWERIKGDSRLRFEEALPAIRAAWERMGRQRERAPA